MRQYALNQLLLLILSNYEAALGRYMSCDWKNRRGHVIWAFHFWPKTDTVQQSQDDSPSMNGWQLYRLEL